MLPGSVTGARPGPALLCSSSHPPGPGHRRGRWAHRGRAAPPPPRLGWALPGWPRPCPPPSARPPAAAHASTLLLPPPPPGGRCPRQGWRPSRSWSSNPAPPPSTCGLSASLTGRWVAPAAHSPPWRPPRPLTAGPGRSVPSPRPFPPPRPPALSRHRGAGGRRRRIGPRVPAVSCHRPRLRHFGAVAAAAGACASASRCPPAPRRPPGGCSAPARPPQRALAAGKAGLSGDAGGSGRAGARGGRCLGVCHHLQLLRAPGCPLHHRGLGPPP